MGRLLRYLVVLAVIGAAAAWLLSRPRTLPDDTFAGLTGDVANGAAVFWAGGCASCHAAPGSDDMLTLSGGEQIASPFGTFVVPNISPDPIAGIGGWTLAQFGNALQRGVAPDGSHYYPAFPYTAYIRMTPQDVADLKAYIDTLPAADLASQPHDVGFPFNLRRGLGLWKLRYLKPGNVITAAPGAELARGRYLVEALAHCGECHTPRDGVGGLNTDQWLAGAPDPSGKGRVPAITPAALGWEARDIAYYLESGFTPDFDSAGGHMAKVVDNMAKLTEADRAAIAAYLIALP